MLSKLTQLKKLYLSNDSYSIGKNIKLGRLIPSLPSLQGVYLDGCHEVKSLSAKKLNELASNNPKVSFYVRPASLVMPQQYCFENECEIFHASEYEETNPNGDESSDDGMSEDE